MKSHEENIITHREKINSLLGETNEAQNDRISNSAKIIKL